MKRPWAPVEAGLTPGPVSLKFDRRRMVSPEPSNRPIATMTLRIPLSTSARRTPAPFDQPLDADGPGEPGDRLAGGRLRGSAIAAGRDRRTRRSPSCWATRSRGGGPSSTGRPSATRRCGPAWSRELEREEGRPAGILQGGRCPRTVVTTGSAQLIYLVCEALLDPGDIVLVESPTYFVFLGPLGDPRRAGHPDPDRRGRAPARRAGGHPGAAGGRGAARAGQADLHDPRARQPDRDQPGRRSPRAAGRAGAAVVAGSSGSSCWRTPPTGGCRSGRASRRASGATIARAIP